MAEPVMKIIDADGDVYYVEGSEKLDAVAAFGSDCEIHHGYWQPRDLEAVPNNQGDQNGCN